MKKLSKILLSAMLLIGFSACKKNYSCACVTTIIYSGTISSQDIVNSATKQYSSTMTEKQAKAACAHEAESINSTFDDNIKQSSVNGRVTAETSCSLR